jgi:hypothetical protein
MATRALTPTFKAAHTPTRNPHHTGTLRRNGHGPGSPTQSGTPHQNIRLGEHIPGCIHITPTPNNTNAREIAPPITPLFHRSLEYPTPTRYYSYHANKPTNKISHMHRHNHSQPTHLSTDHTKGHTQNTPTRTSPQAHNKTSTLPLYLPAPRHRIHIRQHS